MSYEIQIRPDLNIAFFKFEGRVTTREATQSFLDYVARPDFSPQLIMLSDAREVTHVDSQFLEIFSHIQGLSTPLKQFENGTTSVVLVSNELVYGMIRMLEQVLDIFSAITIKVTKEEAKALRLCGRHETRLSEIWPTP